MVKIDRIAIIGVGLIGGSTALALKRAGVVDEVIGRLVDRCFPGRCAFCAGTAGTLARSFTDGLVNEAGRSVGLSADRPAAVRVAAEKSKKLGQT